RRVLTARYGIDSKPRKPEADGQAVDQHRIVFHYEYAHKCVFYSPLASKQSWLKAALSWSFHLRPAPVRSAQEAMEMMRVFLLGLVFLSFFAAPLQANPLPADSAFQLTVSRNADGSLRFGWSIADGYYLYREH